MKRQSENMDPMFGVKYQLELKKNILSPQSVSFHLISIIYTVYQELIHIYEDTQAMTQPYITD